MRKARIFVNKQLAGVLEEFSNEKYLFAYDINYQGDPVSLTLPINNVVYEFNEFPKFLEGLLPEGEMLQALLRKFKLDKNDYLGQLFQVGHDVVGALTLEEIK